MMWYLQKLKKKKKREKRSIKPESNQASSSDSQFTGNMAHDPCMTHKDLISKARNVENFYRSNKLFFQQINDIFKK